MRSKAHAKVEDTGKQNSSIPRSGQPDVVLIYPYVQHERDAVGVCVEQLASYLAQEDALRTHILCIDDTAAAASRAPTSRRKARRILRAYDQLAFLVRVYLYLRTLRTVRDLIVITVDAPTGIGIPVQFAKWKNPTISHIAWVMDLYRLRANSRSSFLSRIRAIIEAQTLKNSDHIVTLGECMRTNLVAILDRDIVVLPIWQDETWLQPSSRIDTGYPNFRPIDLVYSGSARIGVHPLGEIADAVLRYKSPERIRLVIRGRGDEVDHLRARIPQGSKAVIFEQPVAHSDAPAALARADIHLVSLAADATGTCVPSKAYASMAVGRPLLYVGDSRGQAARDISSARCGYVVEPGSNISEKLDIILKSTNELSQAGMRGHSFFLENRSLSAMGQRWTHFLREVKASGYGFDN